MVLVSVGVGRLLVLQSQEDFIVSLKIESVLGYVNEGGHAAAADGACPPLVVEVVGGPGQSYDGILVIAQKLPCVLFVGGGHGQRSADNVHRQIAGVGQALVGGLRHPSGLQMGEVDAVCKGVGFYHHLLPRIDFGEEVGGHRSPGLGYAFHPGEGIHVLPGEPQRGDQLEIKQGLLVQVFLARSHHVRLADAQSGEESHAQSHNGQDRQIAAHALADLPQGGSKQRLNHHSISSTGTGWSLTSWEVTVPFFTWITRSAMAVRALLWVMMMTVMPFFRLMSWSSLRMDLPVL